MSAEGIGG